MNLLELMNGFCMKWNPQRAVLAEDFLKLVHGTCKNDWYLVLHKKA
jgi:hypothetical protein